MNLDELRTQINALDIQILELVAKRLALSPEVAAYKKANNLPQLQPKREKELIALWRKEAESRGVNPDVGEHIFKILLEESHKIQERILSSDK